ncbi:OsmC family protein [Pengzhenrongella frigida]|uniref:OsmC family peroxiredoxin n=1 Tax=Pengzhenrongella frigida TaxID=1259133 RepID=A0A4Q5MWI1_9MICO|nr:OsmC family protein [Cellulomonas sp. HLT2-17]RYV49929.1 OsmC family peroxiredoxin [Cellulomonas sp. HLT2-17]
MTAVSALPPATEIAPPETWAERTGPRTYTGRNSRGAEVLMGPADAGSVFTPGELLKVALAGCCGMSADIPLARRLGPDFAATVRVSGVSDPSDDRYPLLSEELAVDLSSLEGAALERLLTVVQRAVDEHCTVARTLVAGAAVELTVTGPRSDLVES